MTTTGGQSTTDAQAGYADDPIGRVAAGNGIEYAYHDLGAGEVPLVLLQHFRGNLDNWDPALIDDLAAGRIFGKKANRDAPTTWQTRQAQYDAVCRWGIPNHSLLQRVSAIELPVFVANGDSDPMILPRYSYLLTGLLPDARLKIYPDSAHGFLFQHHGQFAADVNAFLAGAG